jgi:hypothetical protein
MGSIPWNLTTLMAQRNSRQIAVEWAWVKFSAPTVVVTARRVVLVADHHYAGSGCTEQIEFRRCR